MPQFFICNISILIQLKISYNFHNHFLIHQLFRNVLFNFQTYGAFEVIFSLSISGLFVLWLENVLYMISDF